MKGIHGDRFGSPKLVGSTRYALMAVSPAVPILYIQSDSRATVYKQLSARYIKKENTHNVKDATTNCYPLPQNGQEIGSLT